MADLDEQRRKVEELKRKILEQKKKGGVEPPSEPPSVKPPEVDKTKAEQAARQAQEAQRQAIEAQRQAQEAQRQAAVESQKRADDAKRQSEDAARKQQEDRQRAEAAKAQQPQHSAALVSLQAYAQALRQAWADGQLSKDEDVLLSTLRKSMGINDQEQQNVEAVEL